MPDTQTPKAVRRGQHHTINPQDPSALFSIPNPFIFGPLDLQTFQWVPILIVFIYDSDPSSPGTSPVSYDRLRDSLSYLLNHYPHLSGRLRADTETGNHVIDRLGTGVALHDATIGQPLSAFKKSGRYSVLDFPGGGDDLLAPYLSTRETICEDPIFSIQQTTFACGGVALGFRWPHVVTDGLDTAERGKLPADRKPCLTPYPAGFGSDETEVRKAREYRPALFKLAGPTTPPLAPKEPPMSGGEVHMSSADLAKIKSLAAGFDPENKVSTFVALTSWLHQQIHRARLTLQSQSPECHTITTADFLTAINLRSGDRLPDLPTNYFPVGTLAHPVSFSSPELANTPLPEIAKRLHEGMTTSATVGEAAAKTIRWLAAQRNKNNIQFGMRRGQGALMVTQWTQFDLYGEKSVQFVKGHQPACVFPPFAPIAMHDGLVFVLPQQRSGGEPGDGVVLYLNLPEALWEILRRDGLLEVPQ